MSRFNTSTNHPIIPNSQEYMFERQFVVIHSNDINSLKYPSSSNFEIELPQDYLNVQGIRLSDYVFPSNFFTFSLYENNIVMTVKITNPFNPGKYNISDTQLEAIFRALYANIDFEYIVVIQEGFYTADQMATELTNKFNESVSTIIRNYMATDSTAIATGELAVFNANGGYNQFVIAYNQVKQNLWFGNKSSGFTLTNDSSIYSPDNLIASELQCLTNKLPSFKNWGLPSFLGLTRCSIDAQQVLSTPYYNLPRFSYIQETSLTTGFWLSPDSAYKSPDPVLFPTYVYYVEAIEKTNLLGPTDIYKEIQGCNSLDEPIPFADSQFTQTTNITNGIVKSAFARIPITFSPPAILYNIYDPSHSAIKIYNPPAERIRKLRIKFRFHNGLYVPFSNSEYSFVLEFLIYKPQINRQITNTTQQIFIPAALSNF